MRLLAILILTVGCTDALKTYHKEIERMGFIPYLTPLEHGATGTLVGGNAKKLVVATSPETCLPWSSNVRYTQDTQFPEKYEKVRVGAALSTSLFKILGAGSLPIEAGVSFDTVKEMLVEFEGARLEIVDTLKLKEFYEKKMSPGCRDLLERFGLIISAARVDRMRIEFYSEDEGKIRLESEAAVRGLVKFGTGIEWEVEKETKLVFKTPKYVGYRIARLQARDKGVALLRASEVKRGKFKFVDVGLFEKGKGKGGEDMWVSGPSLE